MWPPTSKNIGEWATVGGDLLGAVPGVGPAVRGAKAAVATSRGANAARIATGLKNSRAIVEAAKGAEGATGASRAFQAAKNGAVHFSEYSKAADPSNPIFTGTVGKATRMMGGSDAAAMMASDVTQAGVTGGLAAPTAVSLWDSDPSVADAAVKGTVINDGVVAGGMAAGPMSKVAAFAKAL